MGGRPVLDETLSALSEMQAHDRRRLELEEVLAEHHSGPEHDAALAELGDVLSELERHGFYEADSRAKAVLFGLGFVESDLERDVAEFSGGIRMRIALAKLLVRRPDFLMLDEPTNHLDIEARNWLEDYLANYPGGIILVSHDRYFLDRVTDRTVEVSRGRLIEYRRQLLGLPGRTRAAPRARTGGLRKATRRNRAHGGLHQPLPLPGEQGQAGPEPDQAARKNRAAGVAGRQRKAAHDQFSRMRARRRAGSSNCADAVKRYGDLTVYDGVDLTIERGSRIALVGPQRRRQIDDDEAARGSRTD